MLAGACEQGDGCRVVAARMGRLLARPLDIVARRVQRVPPQEIHHDRSENGPKHRHADEGSDVTQGDPAHRAAGGEHRKVHDGGDSQEQHHNQHRKAQHHDEHLDEAARCLSHLGLRGLNQPVFQEGAVGHVVSLPIPGQAAGDDAPGCFDTGAHPPERRQAAVQVGQRRDEAKADHHQAEEHQQRLKADVHPGTHGDDHECCRRRNEPEQARRSAAVGEDLQDQSARNRARRVDEPVHLEFSCSERGWCILRAGRLIASTITRRRVHPVPNHNRRQLPQPDWLIDREKSPTGRLRRSAAGGASSPA